MRDLLYLSYRHAAHHRARTLILVACFAVVVYLPAVVQVLAARYERSLTRRAEVTPLVMGAKGNRFDLVLNSLYFRPASYDPIELRELERLEAESVGLAVPLNLRFSARGVPVVATSLEYFGARGLSVARGRLPARVGDVVLGAAAAEALGAGPGDAVFSDQRGVLDIASSASIELRVTGVLARAGSPDDGAVFTELGTAWLLEGAMHGHEDAAGVDPRAVYAETEEGVVLNSAVRELGGFSAEDAPRFHMHGDPGSLPLSAVVLFPDTPKSGTIVKARVNAGERMQMLDPSEVVEDLLGFVFRIKSFLDLVSGLLAACVVLMTCLVILLTVRLRAPEMRTLHAIGCGRFTVVGLYLTELGMILGAACVVAGASVAVTLALLPDLVTAV